MKSKRLLLISAAMIFILILTWALSHKHRHSHAPQSTAKQVIVSFYKKYFANWSKPRDQQNQHLELPFSKSFRALLALDEKTCKEKAGTDICGWGADGDVYLDAQENSPSLTFKNSGFTADEPSPGIVNVKMNIYPEIKDAGNYYHRKFQFILIQEDGQWVVNEMVSDGRSARKELTDEINSLKNGN